MGEEDGMDESAISFSSRDVYLMLPRTAIIASDEQPITDNVSFHTYPSRRPVSTHNLFLGAQRDAQSPPGWVLPSSMWLCILRPYPYFFI